MHPDHAFESRDEGTGSSIRAYAITHCCVFALTIPKRPVSRLSTLTSDPVDAICFWAHLFFFNFLPIDLNVYLLASYHRLPPAHSSYSGSSSLGFNPRSSSYRLINPYRMCRIVPSYLSTSSRRTCHDRHFRLPVAIVRACEPVSRSLYTCNCANVGCSMSSSVARSHELRSRDESREAWASVWASPDAPVVNPGCLPSPAAGAYVMDLVGALRICEQHWSCILSPLNIDL